MVIGMTGTGKSAFINAMLGRSSARTSAFADSTKVGCGLPLQRRHAAPAPLPCNTPPLPCPPPNNAALPPPSPPRRPPRRV
jgi:DNA segregation ATPase FtsK/SpoIIIE-like protein